MNLNARSLRLAGSILIHAEELRIVAHSIENGGEYIDFGIAATGGLHAGIALAKVCLADLADVAIVPGAAQGIGRHRIGAGRSADAQVNAARRGSFQQRELLGHRQRRMVGQHHAT